MASFSSRRILDTAAIVITSLVASFPARVEGKEEVTPSTLPEVLYEAPLEAAPLHLVAQASISGKSQPVFVDTGCGVDLLGDITLGEHYGSSMGRATINGREGVSYFLPEVKVGDLILPAHVTPCSDLNSFRYLTGIPLAGVIGWPALKGRTLVLDYDGGRMRIVAGAQALPDATGTLPITQSSGGVPLVQVQLGSREAPLLIDTGDDGSIALSTEEFDRLVEEGWIETAIKDVPSVNAGGIKKVRSGWFTQGTLLGLPLKGISAQVSSWGSINHVGLEFLMKFNLALSSDPASLTYRPRENPQPPITPQLMLGAMLAFDAGHTAVVRVKPGGAGEKAGLRVGDEILSIDEWGDGAMDLRSIYHLCQKQAGKALTLHLKREDQEQKIEMQLPPFISGWDTRAAVEGEK